MAKAASSGERRRSTCSPKCASARLQRRRNGRNLNYTHRAVEGTDLYFVANSQQTPLEAVCTFRVKDRRPELWWPDSGRIEEAAVYDETPEGTRLPLRLDPCGSVFVVFRAGTASSPERVVAVTRDGLPRPIGLRPSS